MKSEKASQTKTVRRSVAVPRKLIEEIYRVAPPDLGGNFNRLVITALRDYSINKKKESFEKAMAEMGADPDILRVVADVSMEFIRADNDGLADD